MRGEAAAQGKILLLVGSHNAGVSGGIGCWRKDFVWGQKGDDALCDPLQSGLLNESSFPCQRVISNA